jgi:hypothetical protein
MEKSGAFFAVRSEFFNYIQTRFGFKWNAEGVSRQKAGSRLP